MKDFITGEPLLPYTTDEDLGDMLGQDLHVETGFAKPIFQTSAGKYSLYVAI